MPVTFSALTRVHIPEIVQLIAAPAQRMLLDAGATPNEAVARVQRLKGPAQILQMLDRPHPDVLFGARDEAGELIGVAGLRVSGPGQAEMHTMYLAQQAQGRGLGRAFFELRLDHARACGLDAVHLRTAASNVRVQRLAASLGFTVDGWLDSTTMPGVVWQLWKRAQLQSDAQRVPGTALEAVDARVHAPVHAPALASTHVPAHARTHASARAGDRALSMPA